MKNDILTFDEANRLFTYDPFTGELRWSANREDIPDVPEHTFAMIAGKEAGCEHRSKTTSYRTVTVRGKALQAHRIIWLLCWEHWPSGEVDHEDGNGLNNRISNLRDVTPIENSRNKRINRNNTSGFNGVLYNKAEKKWVAETKCNGKRIVRQFRTKEEAIAARQEDNMKLGFHELHGTTKE